MNTDTDCINRKFPYPPLLGPCRMRSRYPDGPVLLPVCGYARVNRRRRSAGVSSAYGLAVSDDACSLSGIPPDGSRVITPTETDETWLRKCTVLMKYFGSRTAIRGCLERYWYSINDLGHSRPVHYASFRGLSVSLLFIRMVGRSCRISLIEIL